MMYSNKLKELRESNDLSQIQIAQILNVDNSVYAKYEKEYEIIPLKYLNTLCTYFNVSIDYLFDFNKDKQYKGKINTSINEIEIGKRLKEFRKENKLTQLKLAKLLNTVQPVITNYENGKHLIATPFLYTICKEYHISADYLLGKINNPKYLK